MKYRRVAVWLEKLNTPIEFKALATYTKGPFFCILYLSKNGKQNFVTKFPTAHIFRVVEDYEEQGK